MRKLSEEKILEIRQRLSQPNCYQNDLAQEYGVCEATISNIARKFTITKVVADDPSIANMVTGFRYDLGELRNQFTQLDSKIDKYNKQLAAVKEMLGQHENALVQVLDRVKQHSSFFVTKKSLLPSNE